MANKEQTTYENPTFGAYTGYAENATNMMREVWGMNMKAAQNWYDQSIHASKACADFAQTQIQEGTRLSQEFFKMGQQTSDEFKKTFGYFSEKFFTFGK